MKTDIKLDVNFDTGEGTIRIMPHFKKMNAIWQLDLLGDWIYDLQELYNEKVDDWERELGAFEGVATRLRDIGTLRRDEKNKDEDGGTPALEV